DDLAGDSLTGGYILKIDKTTGAQNEGWISPYPPVPGGWQTTLWQIEYPKIAEVQPAQKAYIQQWITGFEAAMTSPAFADTAVGYPKYIDVQSFVDFTLLNEVAKCVDAYRISTFLYKDKDSKDSRLHAGPVWDFNIALGNAGYCTAENPEGWIIDFNQYCPDDSWVVDYWWTKMWEDPAYRLRLKDRWIELRTGPFSNTNVFHLLDSLTAAVQQAQVRNFERWPVLDTWVWPNVFCCGPYPAHTDFLRNWLGQRLQWMDSAAQTLYVGEFEAEKRFKTLAFPNPTSEGVLKFKCYAHLDDIVLVRVFDPRGSFVQGVQLQPAFNGENTFEWHYDVLRSGTYFYEILLNGQHESSGSIVIVR
ncbi:MAG: CotH kinase family protein, partial [Phycisphaerae bacterium]|nr:CotH kinase family protein [Saprospiraceae bacterium]